MTLQWSVDGDAFHGEWSMLAVGDARQPAASWEPNGDGDELLSRFAGYFDGWGLAGTIARAGEGWLQGTGSWRHTSVRLESHAAEPAAENEPWCEAVETPYVTRTGVIEFFGANEVELKLNGTGAYRVRALLRREDEHDQWCLRFWRVTEPVEPPQWLARSAPAVGVVPADWMAVLPEPVWQLYRMVQAEAAGTDAPISLARAAARYESRSWPFDSELKEGWLDADLWTVREPLPTGHADLDLENRRGWRDGAVYTARRKNKWRELSERLCVPLPATLRDAFALLVAAGLLHAETAGYRVAAAPPPAGDVLGLAPEQREGHAERRHRANRLSLAGDIYALAAWSPGHMITATAAEFADRLLIGIGDFRSALPYAQEVGLTTAQTGPNDPITLTARRRGDDVKDCDSADVGLDDAEMADEDDPFDAEDAELLHALDQHEWPADSDPALLSVGGWAQDEDPDPEAGLEDQLTEAEEFFGYQDAEEGWLLPGREHPEAVSAEFGAAGPPRAGLFRCDGRVIVWRGGRPEIFGRTDPCDLVPESNCLRDGPDVALDTPYGVVLAGLDKEDFEDWQEGRLVQPDGTVRRLGYGIRTLQRSCDGRSVAISTRDDVVRLVDLAGGGSETMPGLDGDFWLQVIGVFAGQVYFNRSSIIGPRYQGTWRWCPGQVPEQLDVLLQWVDPISGTALAARKDCRLLIAADGTTRRLLIDPSAKLAPGGQLLYTMRRDPHAVTFFDVHDWGRNPRIVWLPPDCDPRYFGGPDMVWEDTRHLLIPGGGGLRGAPCPAYRLDVQTGHLERLPVYGRADDIPLFIQPVFPTC